MYSVETCGVSEGDRFVKSINPRGRAWQVIEIRITVDGIPHARLASCDNKSSEQTISTLTLRDRNYWLPAGAAPRDAD